MVNNNEIGLVLLRIAEVIGQDKIERIDEDTIYCGLLNFTYAEFENVYFRNATDLCLLKDGERRVSIENLFLDLLNDYSFNMSTKMDEF